MYYSGLPAILNIDLNFIKNRGDSLRWPRHTLYPLKLALTSPTSGGRSVGIVRLRTKATEFVLFLFVCLLVSHMKYCFALRLCYDAISTNGAT
jgi:hypothetical protein